MNLAGLHLLSHLERICPTTTHDDRKSTLALLSCVIAFLEPQEAWSSPETAELAKTFTSRILNKFVEFKQQKQKIQFAIIRLLDQHVKPQFAMSRSSVLTGQGRKAIYLSTDNNNHNNQSTYSNNEAQMKPWKFDHVYIVTVLQWIMGNLDVRKFFFDAMVKKKKIPFLQPAKVFFISKRPSRSKLTGPCLFRHCLP